MNIWFKFLFFIIALSVGCQLNQKGSERTDKGLSTYELQKEWEKLLHADQAKRGLQTNAKWDLENMKSALKLIQNYGWPSSDLGHTLNIAPHIIFRHQSSPKIKEYILPLIYENWKKGLVDTTWFLMNIEEVFRDKYGRELIRGREATIEDFDEYIQYLDFKRKAHYKLKNLDQMLEIHLANESRLDELRAKGAKYQSDHVTLTIFTDNNKLFYQKEYVDGSKGEPHEIVWDIETGSYKHRLDIGLNDTFEKMKNGDLTERKEGLEGKASIYRAI